jgi:hypothetical protein
MRLVRVGIADHDRDDALAKIVVGQSGDRGLGHTLVPFDDPVLMGAASTIIATNNGVQYSLSPAALIITQGSTVLSNDRMLTWEIAWPTSRSGHVAPN